MPAGGAACLLTQAGRTLLLPEGKGNAVLGCHLAESWSSLHSTRWAGGEKLLNLVRF